MLSSMQNDTPASNANFHQDSALTGLINPVDECNDQLESKEHSENVPSLPDEEPSSETDEKSLSKSTETVIHSQGLPPVSDEASPHTKNSPPLADVEPPLPDEEPPNRHAEPPLLGAAPPLPDEEPPSDAANAVQESNLVSTHRTNAAESNRVQHDNAATGNQKVAWSEDGMVAAVWDDNAQAYFFWDRRTGKSTWTNPLDDQDSEDPYTYSASFNTRTGKFQTKLFLADKTFFTETARMEEVEKQYADIDNLREYNKGKSLKEERRNMKYSKAERQKLMKAWKERKDEKRRSWLIKASDDDQPWRKKYRR